ncbi:MAG: sensor histidine kinase, partial [Cellulosilyticaceae bacterium]
NLDYVVEIRGDDELAKLGRDMSYMEMQLKKQIEERMQAERTKNELVTNVAHDLRTPLTSIIGYMGLVKDGKYEDAEECKRYLDIAYSKSERLKVLIEDLFEYTKLSNRVIDLKREHISSTLLMNQLIEELRPQAEEKNIRMNIHALAGESGVYVDILKMARVFENLLENAIKYSKEDEVIQVIIQAKNGYVYTSVRNRCASTPEGDITKLFDRFYRTDTSRNSTTGGSGLGLAIAKNIVEMHDGKIWAQLDGDRISFNVKLKQI